MARRYDKHPAEDGTRRVVTRFRRDHWRVADVADEAAVRAATDELAGELGGLDAVVASAGIEGEMGAQVTEVTSADFRRVLEVNVLGVFHLVKAAVPHLAEPTTAATVARVTQGAGGGREDRPRRPPTRRQPSPLGTPTTTGHLRDHLTTFH